jgi:hypothetical protein
MFELKSLSPAAIPAALAKAERYRLLNEPEQSQSICEDVLRADPDNRDAKVMLILALSDQFALHLPQAAGRAADLVAELASEYERAYYAAGEWLGEAMDQYERADALRPADNDEARLRWNACARTLNARPDLLAPDELEAPVMNE